MLLKYLRYAPICSTRSTPRNLLHKPSRLRLLPQVVAAGPRCKYRTNPRHHSVYNNPNQLNHPRSINHRRYLLLSPFSNQAFKAITPDISSRSSRRHNNFNLNLVVPLIPRWLRIPTLIRTTHEGLRGSPQRSRAAVFFTAPLRLLNPCSASAWISFSCETDLLCL